MEKNQNKIIEVFGGALAGTFGLAIAALFLMSVPLSILYVIRITEWDWWWALLLIVVAQGVPGIGQIGIIVAAVMGAYHFVSEDFSWERAAYPERIETYNVSELSPEEFKRYKEQLVIPGIESSCKNWAEENAGFDNRINQKVSSYCECYAERLGGSLSKAEAIESEKRGNMEHVVRDRGNRIDRQCKQEVRGQY